MERWIYEPVLWQIPCNGLAASLLGQPLEHAPSQPLGRQVSWARPFVQALWARLFVQAFVPAPWAGLCTSPLANPLWQPLGSFLGQVSDQARGAFVFGICLVACPAFCGWSPRRPLVASELAGNSQSLDIVTFINMIYFSKLTFKFMSVYISLHSNY